MRNSASDDKITILLLGPLHAGVRDGLAGCFKLVEITSAEIGMLAPDLAAEIRGIACAGSIPSPLLDGLRNLEIIASFGVGYDGIDVRAASQRGVVVTNTPDILDDEVADTAIWLLLEATRGFSRAEKWMRDGEWEREGAYALSPRTLRGRSVGIFGLGRIGRAIARRLEGLRLPVSYHNRQPLTDVSYPYHPSLQALAQAVDTLIAVVPGGQSTTAAVNDEVLGALGSGGVFINVGRGTAVDEEALIRCLKDGTIAAAGLDVFASEPDVSADLLMLDNVTVLPHIAAATVDARAAVARLVVANLLEWFTHHRALTPVPGRAESNRG